MSTKSSIKLSNIIKRSSCINSVSETTDSDRLFNIIENALNNDTPNLTVAQQNLRYYIESMCNAQNATEYYYQPFVLIENLNDKNPNMAAVLTLEYCNRIIPYIKNLDEVMDSVNNHYNITEEQKDLIREAASINNAADRILANHDKISKRFNIENEAKRYKTVGLKYLVDSCAEMIDTYNIKNYQKFNIVIEEVSYILDKNGYDYSRKDLAKYCLEYFLSSTPYISGADKNNYKRVLEESYILNECDSEELVDIFGGNDDAKPSIQNMINNFLTNPNKSADLLDNAIENILPATTKDDIIYNIDKLLYLVWDLCKNKTFESDDNDDLYDCIKTIGKYICSCVDHDNCEFTKEDILAIINSIEKVKSQITNVSNCNNMYTMDAAEFIDKALNPMLFHLNRVANIVYYKNNIDNIGFVNSDHDNEDFDKFKAHKFHDMARFAYNLARIADIKRNRIPDGDFRTYNTLKDSQLDLENTIYEFIGEDCKADICIRQYVGEVSNVEDLLDNICNEFNDVLDSNNMDSARAYYIINPGIAEIRLKESTKINLDDDQMKLVRESIAPDMENYALMVNESNKIYEDNKNIEFKSLDESLVDFSDYDNFTMDHFKLALEAMKYLNIDKNTVKLFGERFANYNFNNALMSGTINESYIGLARDERFISESIDNIKFEVNVPYEIQLEAYNLLLDIMEEAGKPAVGGKAIEQNRNNHEDDDDDEEDDDDEYEYDDDKKSKIRGVNKDAAAKADEDKVLDGMKAYQQKGKKISLVNIKLALKGVQTKMKDMSTKEKEASRNLDNAARVFIKATRDALTNNRREAIIKGSLIPSFSRCIKAGIVTAGIGIVSPPLAIITAMGGIAVSKKLNDRERLLLLDEIETEVEVVDKELQIADNNSDMKKYRALLQYKKDLQRQYQRIKYNMRVGKDILPGSYLGTPHGSRD